MISLSTQGIVSERFLIDPPEVKLTFDCCIRHKSRWWLAG